MVIATQPAHAFATQVLQVATVVSAVQITTGRHVNCTATVLLCATTMVDVVQMQHVNVMKDTMEKLALSSATPSRRALAVASATHMADVSVRQTSLQTTAASSAPLLPAVMHHTAAAMPKAIVNALGIS